MLILQGPDQRLRFNLFTRMKRHVSPKPAYQFRIARETERVDLRHLVSIVHDEHSLLIRDGFETGLPHDDPALYMLGMALASAGSVVVLCGVNSAQEIKELTFGGILPAIMIMESNDETILNILDVWADEIIKTVPLFEFWGSGGRPDDCTMLVGEANQELGTIKRRAFTSHTGCSIFLHQALMANGHRRYYLTNAQKTSNQRQDKIQLQQEIDLLQPSKIVAMGKEAAIMLSQLKIPFITTFHPQYWKRFKHYQQQELIELLK